MKNFFKTYEIPHLWAHQTQEHARNPQNSLFFDGATIYSYGHHFPIATIHHGPDGEDVYFVTTETFSKTTAQHISAVRLSIPSDAPRFNVESPQKSPTSQLSYFESRIKDATENFLKATRKPTRLKLMGQLQGAVEDANRFAAYFKLAERFSVPSDFDALKAEYEAKQAAEQAATEARERQEAEEQARREAQRLKKAAGDIAAWKNGGPLPNSVYSLSKVFLRIVGEDVETSHGANFPIADAITGLALVEQVRGTGKPYHRNGHTLHLGPYKVDRIEADGTVIAGCHRVEWDEIAAIADQLKAAPTA